MAEYISSLTGQQMDASLLDMAQHNSEAWAVGKRNGQDVSTVDPTYHNNAKWYAGHISEAGHPPYIGENGNWYEWDSTEVAYVDTGVRAGGIDGEDGVGIESIEKTSTTGLVDTYTITFTDETTTTFDVTNGSSIASITKTGTSGLIDTYTVTLTDGTTTTFEVTNGANGLNASVTVVEYQASNDGTTIPTGTWTTTIPTVAGGQFLWVRFTWNTGTYSYFPTKYGNDGLGTGDMLKSVYSPNYTGELASNTDLTAHTTDTTIHTNSTEKASWDGKAEKPDMGTITTTTSWSGSASPYSQVVSVSGATVTSNSKVDLQPDSTTLAQMLEDGCNALYIENNAGTLTLYAIGEAPTVALTIQVSVSEVTL